MQARKLVRLIGAVSVVASAPVLMALSAQAQSPAPTPPTESQPNAKTDPSTKPMPGQLPTVDQKPSPGTSGKTTGSLPSETKKDPMIGLTVLGADGQKLGQVRDVKAAADGKVEAIHVHTGGFLGFGGKTVAIPAGKFNLSGQNVQLGLSADDVSKLPRVEDKQS